MSAEFAAALPAVLVLLALCLAAVQLGVHQVRVQDAAAVAARVSARGDGASAGGYVAQLVPGADVVMAVRADLVCATVTGGPAAGPFRAIRMSATSCAPESGG